MMGVGVLNLLKNLKGMTFHLFVLLHHLEHFLLIMEA